MREDAGTEAKARLEFPGTSTDEWTGYLCVGFSKPIRGTENNPGIKKKRKPYLDHAHLLLLAVWCGRLKPERAVTPGPLMSI